MAGPGAPLGNQNAAKAKVWAAAIGRALDKRSSEGRLQALDELANVLLDQAASGEGWALKELGDRLDGKPAMIVGGDGSMEPIKLVVAWKSS